jgi:ParB-like chromosome segregation protein Spo0J
MKKIKMKALEAKLVPIEKLEANNWNPNRVAKPEMNLLKKSIEDNGFCFPIATIYDKINDKYVIIDGFHRYTVAKDYLHLKEVPIVVLDHDIKMQISATIQFNRARGTHQIPGMSNVVIRLLNEGWSDLEICNHLGMDLDEVIRLKQISGLKEAFSNHEFSKSWEEFESKLKENEYEI